MSPPRPTKRSNQVAPLPRDFKGHSRRIKMVRFGNNTFQSFAGIFMYTAVLATVGVSIASALSPLMA